MPTKTSCSRPSFQISAKQTLLEEKRLSLAAAALKIHMMALRKHLIEPRCELLRAVEAAASCELIASSIN